MCVFAYDTKNPRVANGIPTLRGDPIPPSFPYYFYTLIRYLALAHACTKCISKNNVRTEHLIGIERTTSEFGWLSGVACTDIKFGWLQSLQSFYPVTFQFLEFLEKVGAIGFYPVDSLYRQVVCWVVWKVEMPADVNWFVRDICSMMIDSEAQLSGCQTHILFVTLSTCYHIDEI